MFISSTIGREEYNFSFPIAKYWKCDFINCHNFVGFWFIIRWMKEKSQKIGLLFECLLKKCCNGLIWRYCCNFSMEIIYFAYFFRICFFVCLSLFKRLSHFVLMFPFLLFKLQERLGSQHYQHEPFKDGSNIIVCQNF